MGLVTDNVLPGNRGKIFVTNAKDEEETKAIKQAMLKLDGLNDIIVNKKVFPIEMTVHSSKIVPIKDVEKAVNIAGYHAVPKSPYIL